MFAGKFYRVTRCALVVPLIALCWLVPYSGPSQALAPPTQGVAATVGVITNQAAKNVTTRAASPPLPPATKRKAGFMAGAGLAILSLLALAAGLALVRTFKR